MPARTGRASMSPPSRFDRADCGINTYPFTRELGARDCLVRLAGLGYRRFEIMLVPGHFWPSLDGDGGRRDIESLVGHGEIQIMSLNQPNLDVNLSSAVPEMREHSCRMIAYAVELAACWNARGVVINPGKDNPVFPAPDTSLTDAFRRSLDVLVPIAKRAGVSLIVKNHPLSYLHRARDLRRFFDAFGWDHIGIGYDVANGHFAGEAPDTILQVRERLAFLYAADTSRQAFQHARIGTGTVPFESIATLLRTENLSPPTILEILAENAQDALGAGVESLDRVGWPRPASGRQEPRRPASPGEMGGRSAAR